MPLAVVPVLVMQIVEKSLKGVRNCRRCLGHGRRIASAVPEELGCRYSVIQ
jgi:hypothetical protein